ncbi:hypothetical protein BHE74_00004296 [Ensete ventricosum]|uniref:Uncharacterized protein n=1 Tax=Ensete ventricosum TaxID=4639 RepID=A0A444BX37_ENSVE|nr:hypothetical protein B296_00006644 [Ensete ventricosum]RWV78200.1 hypothetical protein GW17_00060860 [Ensete ventricosum]RWW86905.1 hypothetical protein BHE74_00004296 [Ensete ventricosum]
MPRTRGTFRAGLNPELLRGLSAAFCDEIVHHELVHIHLPKPHIFQPPLPLPIHNHPLGRRLHPTDESKREPRD